MKHKGSKTINKKKDSAKKQLKKNELFDENGKLITIQKETANKELQNPLSSDEERKEKQRQRWRDYYHNNKDKYKEWNKRWREKQKAKSKEA